MDNVLIIITALTFYGLGRYAGSESEFVNKVKKKAHRLMNTTKAGPIDYPTPEQVAFRGSEDEKIDEEAKKLLQDKGFNV